MNVQVLIVQELEKVIGMKVQSLCNAMLEKRIESVENN